MSRIQNNENKAAAAAAASGFDENPEVGFDADDLPGDEQLVVNEESEQPQQTARYQYRPSETTLKKLDAMPKKALAEEFGIYLDDYVMTDKKTGKETVKKGLISSVTEYGVLEDLAEGRYTRKPIRIQERIGHKRDTRHYALVKFMPASANGKYDWTVETRPVDMRYKLDKDGNRIKDNFGHYEMTCVQKKLDKNQVVRIGSGDFERDLTPEEHDQVRLLGNIEGAVPNKNLINQVWVANQYDPTILVAVNCNYILASLDRREGKGTYLSGGKKHEFTFGSREKNLWASGKGAYVKNEEGKNQFVRYDPLKGRFSVSVTLDIALKKDRERELAANKQTESASVAKKPVREKPETPARRI